MLLRLFLGERKRDPRHIYANPKCPQICSILSLGIYLICLPTFHSEIFCLVLVGQVSFVLGTA
jgi:hypothetical protein